MFLILLSALQDVQQEIRNALLCVSMGVQKRTSYICIRIVNVIIISLRRVLVSFGRFEGRSRDGTCSTHTGHLLHLASRSFEYRIKYTIIPL